MFAGCFEITITVIVKHAQHVEVIPVFRLLVADLLSFSVPGRQE